MVNQPRRRMAHLMHERSLQLAFAVEHFDRQLDARGVLPSRALQGPLCGGPLVVCDPGGRLEVLAPGYWKLGGQHVAKRLVVVPAQKCRFVFRLLQY